MKFNALLTNDLLIFHNALDIAEIVRQSLEEGWKTDTEDLAHLAPPDRAHQMGEPTHELGIPPEANDPKPDVDFTLLRERDLTTACIGQAA